MKIRKATLKDIQQMLKVIGLNSPKYPKTLAKKEIKEMFSGSLHKPTYLIIEDNREIVAFGGFIRSWVDDMIFNIFWVNTNPQYKNKGFGTKLIEGLILFFASIVAWAFAMVPFIGWALGGIVWIAWIVLWVIGIIYSLSGEMKEIPVIGQFARKINL